MKLTLIISISDNLDEDSKYEAKVEARNMFGWSNQSNSFSFFTRNAGMNLKKEKKNYFFNNLFR